MTTREQVVALLKILLRELDSVSDDELGDILAGKSTRRILHKPTRKPKRGEKPLSVNDIDALINKLSASGSREHARAILASDATTMTRSTLGTVAKALKVHVNKHDTRDALLDKIVEAVVGVRLRSEAILGLNLKSSGSARE